MAPSATPSTVTSPNSASMGGLTTSRFASRASNSREATPTAAKAKAPVNGDAEGSVFKSDLTNIKNLVTCSICDQLLYEPWTLGCGHTYCYSCLCNWFVPNKRKKTCPECRTVVKQMPAPAFLVKQMVEIFCKRSELMPSDESVDQHNTKRAEEIAAVDKDRNGADGLFKGTFSITRGAELLFDEADGVFRCSSCHHEYEEGGSPLCTVCGAIFDLEDGFSDLDEDNDFDLDELEVDLAEEALAGNRHRFFGGHMHHFSFHNHRIHHHPHPHHDSLGESSDGSDIDGDSDEDEDEGSLQDFVIRDDEPNHNRAVNNGPNGRQTITISDDESDEGGAVSNGRRRTYRGRGAPSSSPTAPSILTLTDSENGENNDEAEMLTRSGWSPLETDNESDAEEPYYRRPGYVSPQYASTDDDHNSGEESDTNTMRNEGSDDDEDQSRDDLSETPTYQYNGNTYMLDRGTPNTYLSDDEAELSEMEFPQGMDRDGDTEMSASPGPSNTSHGASVSSGYGYDGEEELYGYDDQGTPREHRGSSTSTHYAEDVSGVNIIPRGHRGPSAITQYAENLGGANHIHEIDDNSSDGSIQPPPRRRPRQRHGNPQVQQTDPRISMMFAEHQQSLRGTQDQQQGLEGLDDEVRRTEPASRNRRLTAYRLAPPHRVNSLRNSRSPSATRIISSSNRVARPPRQYRRYH